MATYSYLRVSTIEQNTDKNKMEIVNFIKSKGLGAFEFIEENISGKSNFKNRQLGKLLDKIQKGDVLIVPELSRLARSISQIFEIIDLAKRKGFVLYSLKENFSTDDESITATITSTIFALVAQLERELISLRTKEALQAKKQQGVKLGRPQGRGKSKLDEHKADILKLVELKVPKTMIARQYNTSVVNLYLIAKTIQMLSSKQVRFDESGKTNLVNWYALIFVPSGGGKDRLVRYLNDFIFKDFREWYKAKANEIYEIQLEEYKKSIEEDLKNKSNSKKPASKEEMKQQLTVVKGESKNGTVYNPF